MKAKRIPGPIPPPPPAEDVVVVTMTLDEAFSLSLINGAYYGGNSAAALNDLHAALVSALAPRT